LWINLVTDAFPALTLIAEPESRNLMKRPPRNPTERILGRKEWVQVGWVGLLEASAMLILYWQIIGEHGAAYARNIVFTSVVFSQLLRSLSARSTTYVIWEIGIFSNLWLLGVLITTA